MTSAISAARRFVTLHPGSSDAAYAQFLIGSAYYEQIPDVTRDQGRTEKAIAALEEVSRKYPDSEYAAERQAQDRGRARPARRQGDGDRPLLPEPEGFHRRDQPLQDRGDAVPDHPPCRGGADAPDRGLYGARRRQRGADRGRGARPQLPGQPLVCRRLPAGAGGRLRADREQGLLDQPGLREHHRRPLRQPRARHVIHSAAVCAAAADCAAHPLSSACRRLDFATC